MIRPYLLHNGTVRRSDEASLLPGQVGLFSGWGIFSTVKIVNGVLFAFERHWARLRKDADLLRVPFPWAPEELEAMLLRLVEANEDFDASLRILIVRNRGTIWDGPGFDGEYDLVAFTAPRTAWGSAARLGVVPKARQADNPFAGTKTTSWAANLVWYEEAHRRGQDEVVLLNERDEVSECTSANLFAVSGDRALTPPLNAGCLPGVTRQVLMEEVRTPGIEIAERALTLDDLNNADSVFITSTTRDLLPVVSIEGLNVKTDDRVRSVLAQAFQDYQNQYVANARQRANRRTT